MEYKAEQQQTYVDVALLAEGVDRNPVQEAEVNPAPGRPPCGGRG